MRTTPGGVRLLTIIGLNVTRKIVDRHDMNVVILRKYFRMLFKEEDFEVRYWRETEGPSFIRAKISQTERPIWWEAAVVWERREARRVEKAHARRRDVCFKSMERFAESICWRMYFGEWAAAEAAEIEAFGFNIIFSLNKNPRIPQLAYTPTTVLIAAPLIPNPHVKISTGSRTKLMKQARTLDIRLGTVSPWPRDMPSKTAERRTAGAEKERIFR